MASPTFRNKSTAANPASPVTMTEPASTASGDGLLLVIHMAATNTAFVAPTGWTLLGSATGTSSVTRYYAARRGAVAPGLSYSFTGAGWNEYVMLGWSANLASGDAWIESFTVPAAIESVNTNPAALTTKTPDTTLVAFYGSWFGWGSDPAPAGYTTRHFITTNNTYVASRDLAVANTTEDPPNALAGGSATVSTATIVLASSVPGTSRPRIVLAGIQRGPLAKALHMQQRWQPAVAVVTDVTVALSGVSITSAVGSLAVDVSVALSGVATTTAAGSVAVSVSLALSGVASTSAAGTVVPSTSKTLTGVASTTSAGSVAPSTSVALTGVASTSSVGSLSPSNTISITGVAVTGSAGTLVPSTTVSLSGVQITSAAGTVTFTTGSDVTVTLTGVSMTSSVGTLTPTISRALSGVAITVTAGTLTVSGSGFVEISVTPGGSFATQTVTNSVTFVESTDSPTTDFVEIDPPHGGPFS